MNLCECRISTAADGGHNVRARTGEYLELRLHDYDEFLDVLPVGVYPVGLIKCDIFNDTITFFDMSIKEIVKFNGEDGTMVMNNNVFIGAEKERV